MTKREKIVFFAGVEAFHTLSHLLLLAPGVLPLRYGKFTITPRMNRFAILANAAVTAGLLYWAAKAEPGPAQAEPRFVEAEQILA